MSTITIHEAQTRLSELIRSLRPNDEVVITDHDRPAAPLLPAQTGGAKRNLGNLRETVTHMAADFRRPGR